MYLVSRKFTLRGYQPVPRLYLEINLMRYIFFSFLLAFFCFSARAVQPDTIDLRGIWTFRADPADEGSDKGWAKMLFTGQITLPGSMNGNNKGEEISLKTAWTGSIYDSSFYYNPRLAKYRQPGNIHIPFWLSPLKHYVGAAWYNREVTIPQSWQGRRIVLNLERCHFKTSVRVDGQVIGSQNSLVAPHVYDLTAVLSTGRHIISICIDNRLKDLNVGPDSHSVTDHTQGNWNGIIGAINLKAGSAIFVNNVQVYPNIRKRKARVLLSIRNQGTGKQTGTIDLRAKSFNSVHSNESAPAVVRYSVAAGAEQQVSAELSFDESMLLWDEFHPALYKLNVSLRQDRRLIDSTSREFGMREISIQGKQFFINGRPLSLRGTVNNCEFPLTGYPPTDLKSWMRIFHIARSYGLNHMRFHSWCPPEAAFRAADRLGFYLQPEGPSWPNHGPKIGLGQPIDKYLYDETMRMENLYGNYASYIMLSGGNEPAGNQVSYLNAFIDFWKQRDSRRVYTGMSVGGSWPVVPQAQYQVRGGVRGLTWNRRPESISDYSSGLSPFNVPFITHEMGQYCAFPNFDEIKKYTGFYRAKNFELFRQDLADRGMAGQARDFLMASGRLQLLCYKNEIEKMLRTPDYAGFQLLGLQDFPGQGTALVGVLDAFWDSKGYAAPGEFSRFCNSTVPLASLPKFSFSNDEPFEAELKVYHSGEKPLKDARFLWSISDASGKRLAGGSIVKDSVPNANGIPVGKINFSLAGLVQASQLKLEVKIEGTGFANDWSFWVYPSRAERKKDVVHYADSLGEEERKILERGGKVFLNVYGRVVKGREVVMNFLPVFWNTSWFKMRPPHVTGMLIDHKSAAFDDFPTSYHSDLQWWDPVSRNQVMHIEDFPTGFRPLVQPIDTWFLNRRLALLFEAKVGKGKIMVCSADLTSDPEKRPAARQLQLSLSRYMNSPAFNPQQSLEFELIRDLMKTPSREVFNTYTKDSPDELKPGAKKNK